MNCGELFGDLAKPVGFNEVHVHGTHEIEQNDNYTG